MNEYIIIGTAIDYGRGQDGKEWTGLRLVAQKVTQSDGFTKIFKCRVPFDKLPDIGSRCRLLFDEFGRVAECQCIK